MKIVSWEDVDNVNFHQYTVKIIISNCIVFHLFMVMMKSE